MMRYESNVQRGRRTTSHWLCLGLVLVLAAPTVAWAGQVTGLITFANGDPADAEEVNANFDALMSAASDNDARLLDMEALLGASCPPGEFVQGFNGGSVLVCAP